MQNQEDKTNTEGPDPIENGQETDNTADDQSQTDEKEVAESETAEAQIAEL